MFNNFINKLNTINKNIVKISISLAIIFGVGAAIIMALEFAKISKEEQYPTFSKNQIEIVKELELIQNNLKTYYKEHGLYPSEKEGLAALNLPSDIIIDPWGVSYIYTNENGMFNVETLGSNKIKGGAKDELDINIFNMDTFNKYK